MDEAPTARPASRVVLIDAAERLLLFRWLMPADLSGGRERSIWITPGGGLHAGESHEAAAVRELWEETGLRDIPIGPCVWQREAPFRWRGRAFVQQERYFVARLEDAPELTRDNFEEYEKTALAEHRWWSLPEILASEERFVPLELAALLAPILAGELPPAPLLVR